jgi:PAS domain S-box-containing protein
VKRSSPSSFPRPPGEERNTADETHARLAAIVESSHDAIIAKDLNSIVTAWNAAAERLYGYTADEMIGQPITVLYPPELLAEETTILARVRAGERIERYRTRRLRTARRSRSR